MPQGRLWYDLGAILEPFWTNLVRFLSVFWCRFGMGVGRLFGVVLKYCRVACLGFGMIVGSFRAHFRVRVLRISGCSFTTLSLAILGESGRVLASLGDSGRVWASLGESGRVWAGLGESGRVWASLGESGRVWASLGESGRV